jgi:hypothetical protein
MASSRITPFPLYGWVPFRGHLYQITRGEVFRGDRLYHLGRFVGERYDERVLVNHWTLLEGIEERARYAVGSTVRHRVHGPLCVVKRMWRFREGRVRYQLVGVIDPQHRVTCDEDELA